MVMNLFRCMVHKGFYFDFVLQTSEKCYYTDEVQSLGGKIFSSPRFAPDHVPSYCRWWDTFLSQHPEYKIVHGHNNGPAAFYLKSAHEHDAVAIAHSHSIVFGAGVYGLAKRMFQYPIRNVADVRLACSYEAGVALYGNRFSFEVLPNGIPFEKYSYHLVYRDEIRQELDIPQDAMVICSVARFSDIKNQSFIIDVEKRLIEDGANAYALFAGDGELRTACEARALELGVAKRCRFLGVRKDTERLLSASDVFVMPSLYEGLPLAAVEAQASGISVLLSSNIPREADIGGNVRFLPLESSDLWAREVPRFVQESKDRGDISSLDRSFDINVSSKRLAGLYRNLLK